MAADLLTTHAVNRPLERLFVWTGGALFASSIGGLLFWYAFRLGADRPRGGWSAAVVDALLFFVFALHHSALARPVFKRGLSRIVPDRLQRAVYVWIASSLLIAVCTMWRPIGGDLYATPVPFAVILWIVQLAGGWLIVRSVATINALELAGIRSSAGEGLQTEGPYRLVRHPLYLGWMLVVFGAPHMTGDRLWFALVSSAYLLLAIPWEERSLETLFGDAYARYEARVRWRVIPGVY